jgi:hypothetical protein
LGDWHISEQDAYYIFLALFTLGTAPFCFFDFQKTKYMQFGTMFCRNAAFATFVTSSTPTFAYVRASSFTFFLTYIPTAWWSSPSSPSPREMDPP